MFNAGKKQNQKILENHKKIKDAGFDFERIRLFFLHADKTGNKSFSHGDYRGSQDISQTNARITGDDRLSFYGENIYRRDNADLKVPVIDNQAKIHIRGMTTNSYKNKKRALR